MAALCSAANSASGANTALTSALLRHYFGIAMAIGVAKIGSDWINDDERDISRNAAASRGRSSTIENPRLRSLPFSSRSRTAP
jgi:hypothetical protein